MAQGSMVGTRIRERRIVSGIRQSDLARRAGISPSYLNLIEHNRRRIGGKTLLKLAEALEVEPATLSEGAEQALIATLREAVLTQDEQAVELDRVEEFAGRFPGWARLMADTVRRSEMLEQSVQSLTDRLAHDPHLAAALHEVISMVTAVRSTASILADTRELEPEWRARFNRNINEDSHRLAEGAEELMRYLEGAPDRDAEIRSPLDELHVFLDAHGYVFPSLEAGEDENAIEALLSGDGAPVSEAGRKMARYALRQYARDAQRLPLPMMREAIGRHGLYPDRLLPGLDTDPACLLRRLAVLPQDEVGPVGLVICDGSGTLIFRKPVPGFAIPQAAGACALWPLYQVLGQPHMPIRTRLQQSGRGVGDVLSFAVADQVAPAGFDTPPRWHGMMLLVPVSAEPSETPPRTVGVTCRICTEDRCPARREPSIIAKGF